MCATSAGLGKRPAQDPAPYKLRTADPKPGSALHLLPFSKSPRLLWRKTAEFEKTRTRRYPSNHFFLSWAISSATLELGPTGSIKTMCLAFRYIRSGACHSLPRRIRMFFTSLVS